MNVDKAILLLKQWGTPVFKSALAGAMFKAWAAIACSIFAAFLTLVLFKYIWPKAKGEPKVALAIITIIILVVSMCFLFEGVYQLLSLDYQVYKMMLLK